MDDVPLISIIIPVYKVEEYLEKCVDSVRKQTYTNLEIILVNDGSPDNCGILCDRFANEDKRIKVVHKENGGLSDARNVGVSFSSGAYIGFVDSDDYLEPRMYERLYDSLKRYDCDIAECAVNSVYSDTIRFAEKNDDEVLPRNDAILRYLITDGNSIPRTAVWSKLFKRALIEDLVFPKGEIHEDYLYVMIAFSRTEKYALVREGLYNHLYNNPNSITNARFSRKDLYRLVQLDNVRKYVRDLQIDGADGYADANYYRAVIQYYYKCALVGDDDSTRLREILFAEKIEIRKSRLPRKKRAEVFLIKYFPKLYLRIRKNRTT